MLGKRSGDKAYLECSSRVRQQRRLGRRRDIVGSIKVASKLGVARLDGLARARVSEAV